MALVAIGGGTDVVRESVLVVEDPRLVLIIQLVDLLPDLLAGSTLSLLLLKASKQNVVHISELGQPMLLRSQDHVGEHMLALRRSQNVFAVGRAIESCPILNGQVYGDGGLQGIDQVISANGTGPEARPLARQQDGTMPLCTILFQSNDDAGILQQNTLRRSTHEQVQLAPTTRSIWTSRPGDFNF